MKNNDCASTFQSSLDQLTHIRRFVSHYAAEHGFSPKKIYNISLAVDEACTNIIQHAYQNDSNQPIFISLKYNHGCLNIVIKDYGKPYKKNEKKTNKKYGGWGLILMSKVMDSIDYSRSGISNLLRMKINI